MRKIKRINLNIEDEISFARALWNALRCYQKVGEGGTVTFHDGQIASCNKNKKGNLTFKIQEGDEKNEN